VQQQHAAQIAQLHAQHQQNFNTQAGVKMNALMLPLNGSTASQQPAAAPAGAAPAAAGAFSVADLPGIIGQGVDTDLKATSALNRVLRAACPMVAWPCESTFLFGSCRRPATTCHRCKDNRAKTDPPLGTRPAIKDALAAAGNTSTSGEVLAGG
jgi:hypothetical protein